MAQSEPRSPLELQVLELIRKGNCAEAWNVMWRQARQGDTDALAIIVNRAMLGGLVPPSYFPLSKESALQHLEDQMISLRLFAWKNSEILQDFKDHGIAFDDRLTNAVTTDERDAYRRLNACLKSNDDNKARCVQLAVKLRIIPPFGVYVSLMDKAPREAFCIPYPKRPKPGPMVPLPQPSLQR